MKNTDSVVNDMNELLNPGPVPDIVNEKLAQAYEQLGAMPVRQKRPKKLLRSLLVAAVLCGAVSFTVFAASTGFFTMLQGQISFFEQSPSSADATIASLKPSFEAMNAAVNLSATDKDFTFSVLNVSIDDNFINIFGTLSAPNLRELLNSKAGTEKWALNETPDEFSIKYLNMFPAAKINGKLYGQDNSLNDSFNAYFIDDTTIAFARRMLVSDTLPDTFTLEIMPSRITDASGTEFQQIAGTDGNWTVQTEIDLTATKGNVKMIPTQVLSFSDKKLDLKKFSISPLGTIAVVDTHIGEYQGIGPDGQETTIYGPKDGYSTIDYYALKDSEGKWLYSMQPAAWGSRETMTEFTPLSENAVSVSFIPLKLADENAEISTTTAPLQLGGEIKMNSISGYIIESFEINGRRLEMRLQPYGPGCRGNVGISFEPLLQNGNLAYDDSANIAVMNTKTDHLTGAVIYTLDFYQDQPKLKDTALLSYTPMPEMTLDEENAITLPLE